MLTIAAPKLAQVLAGNDGSRGCTIGGWSALAGNTLLSAHLLSKGAKGHMVGEFAGPILAATGWIPAMWLGCEGGRAISERISKK
jgi:hypothetical protein